METFLVTAERRYDTKKSRSCKTRLQPRKWLRSPMTTTRDSNRNRPFERKDYSNNNIDQYNDYRARSPYQSSQDQSRNWRSNNNYSRSPSTSRQDLSLTDFRSQPRSNSPNPSVFNRFGNQDPNKFIPDDEKFPTSNNGNQPNVVRFTTTDDEKNELLGPCPVNC